MHPWHLEENPVYQHYCCCILVLVLSRLIQFFYFLGYIQISWLCKTKDPSEYVYHQGNSTINFLKMFSEILYASILIPIKYIFGEI